MGAQQGRVGTSQAAHTCEKRRRKGGEQERGHEANEAVGLCQAVACVVAHSRPAPNPTRCCCFIWLGTAGCQQLGRLSAAAKECSGGRSQRLLRCSFQHHGRPEYP